MIRTIKRARIVAASKKDDASSLSEDINEGNGEEDSD